MLHTLKVTQYSVYIYIIVYLVSSPPSGCGGDQIINLDESTKSGEHQIRSKGWPQTKYSDREPSQCSWLIAMTPEMKQKNIKIELDFDQLQLEKKAVHCDESDKITIYGSTSCEECYKK